MVDFGTRFLLGLTSRNGPMLTGVARAQEV
jgi:hypothetical protein